MASIPADILAEIEPLVRSGFAIHWLYAKAKNPVGLDWADAPVATIGYLDSTYVTGRNVGVRLGKWSRVQGEFLHVIDMDVREQSKAAEALENLSNLFPDVDFETIPTVQSGSMTASRHFYFVSDKPFSSKKLVHSTAFKMVFDPTKKREVKKWDWEIELFGTGKQVAIPPSIHPDTSKPYRWLRRFNFNALALGITPSIPSSHLETLTRESVEAAAGFEVPPPIGITIEMARDTLAGLPLDNYREDREGWLNVGMALHHEFGGSEPAFALWCEFSKVSEKFDQRDQKRVWKSFRAKPKMLRMATLMQAAKHERHMAMFDSMLDDDMGGDAPLAKVNGHTSPFAHLLDDEPSAKSSPPPREIKLKKEEVEIELGRDVPAKIARLNKKHAVARVAGKTVILDFHPNGTVSYGSVTDLNNFYMNDRVPTDKSTEPVSAAWLRHRQRREYPKGIVFAPGRDVEGAYNHWQGFAVEPSNKGHCTRILRHMKKVLCRGNEEYYAYLIGWLAHLIQRPDEKPGVALVLRGKKGTGKDTLGDYLGKLFPAHRVKISNQEQLLGKFNAHQEKCLFLHVEEGYWAGNKGAEGQLKHLITSETVLIEPKGLNAFQVDSVLRLFMSSNERWVVPASGDERRYFVLDVSDEHRGDRDYFDRLREEMNGAGPAALLHYLQNYPLGDFDVRNAPHTDALNEQKIQGLKNVDLWWYGLLQEGDLDMFGSGAVERRTEAWLLSSVTIECDDLRDGYHRWMRRRRFDGDDLPDFLIGKTLKTLCPEMEPVRPWNGGQRKRAYRFPDLTLCRQRFEEYMGSVIDWPENPPSVDEKFGDDFGDSA
jgi:hypothetical protein